MGDLFPSSPLVEESSSGLVDADLASDASGLASPLLGLLSPLRFVASPSPATTLHSLPTSPLRFGSPVALPLPPPASAVGTGRLSAGVGAAGDASGSTSGATATRHFAFPTATNRALFPHLEESTAAGSWSLPQSPTPFFAHFESAAASAALRDDLMPQAACTAVSRSDSRGSVGGGGGGSGSGTPFAHLSSPVYPYGSIGLECLSGVEEELARDMSFSAGDHDGLEASPLFPTESNPLETAAHAWEEEGAADADAGTEGATGDATLSGAAASPEDLAAEAEASAAADALAVSARVGSARSASGAPDDEEELVASKRRKLSSLHSPRTSSPVREEPPVLPPPTARVCELGLLHRQVTGRLCWTAYQKLSPTDRSCLALLCDAHAAESGSGIPLGLLGGLARLGVPSVKYTQFVPTDQLLQLGLTLERKALDRTLLELQADGRIEPGVLVMRIRRAIPGRVKTGPEFCLLLLFPSRASRITAEAALVAHLPPVSSRLGFLAALVPFRSDFTRRCVWLVPQQLCIGAQYMLPPEAGQLVTTATTNNTATDAPNEEATTTKTEPPTTNPSASETSAIPAPTTTDTDADTPASDRSATEKVTSPPSAPDATRSATPTATSAPVSPLAAAATATQLPLFSALSLHAPPTSEGTTDPDTTDALDSSASTTKHTRDAASRENNAEDTTATTTATETETAPPGAQSEPVTVDPPTPPPPSSPPESVVNSPELTAKLKEVLDELDSSPVLTAPIDNDELQKNAAPVDSRPSSAAPES